ncbi:hypothetical protein COOONC_26970 [Cooperia oncophora]
MLVHVAYPDFILDSKKLDNYYDTNFAFSSSVKETDSYSQMIEKLKRWKIEFDLKRLSKPVDRAEFLADVAEPWRSVQIQSQHSWGICGFSASAILPSIFSKVNIDQTSSEKSITRA